MLSSLKNSVTKRVMNAVAAGTSAQNSSSVDMSDADAVKFTALFGTLTSTAVTSIKAQQSSDNGSADDFTDIEGSSVSIPDTDSNKAAILEIVRPTKQYVRLVISRGTANAVIDGVIAEKFHTRKSPTTQDATVSGSKSLAGPAEGTA